MVGLSSVKKILSDTEKLQRSYGLEGRDEVTVGGRLLDELQGMTLLENEVVAAEYQQREEEAQRMQKRVGIMMKMKWVIKDKENFEKLIDKLTGFNNGLYSLIGPLEGSILAKAVVGELLRTLDLGRLEVLGTAARRTGNAGDIASLAASRQRAVEIMRFPEKIPDMELPDNSEGLTLSNTARDSRRTLGHYRNKKLAPEATGSVLVEWKIIGSNLNGKDKGLLDDTTNSLAFFLNKNNKSKGLRSLTCIGVTKDVTYSAEAVPLWFRLHAPTHVFRKHNSVVFVRCAWR